MGHAYIVEMLASVFFFAVALRLLCAAARREEVAHRVMGACFLLWGASYALWNAPFLLDREDLLVPLFTGGRVLYDVSLVVIAFAVRRLFHAHQGWAAWLVYAVMLLMVLGLSGSMVEGDWMGTAPIGNPWFWLEFAGFTIPFVWVSTAAFTYYDRSRREVRLGLCDPLASNRYLLWGLFGLANLLGNVVTVPQYLEYEAENHFSSSLDALVGAFELLGILAVWLVFFPPGPYRRWVAARAEHLAPPAPG